MVDNSADGESANMRTLPVGIEPTVIAATYPRLYHLTHVDNWDLIRRIGLLSTSALLDLFGIDGKSRRALESSNQATPAFAEAETLADFRI